MAGSSKIKIDWDDIKGWSIAFLCIMLALSIWHIDSLQREMLSKELGGYEEVGCDEIYMKFNNRLVCEIYLVQEDDNVRVFRGEGAIGD